MSASKRKKLTTGKNYRDKALGLTRREILALEAQEGVKPGLVYVKPSSIHGKGMFAQTTIEADKTLGKLITRPASKDGTYILWLSEKRCVEVTNDFRFINHSKDPNCALTGKSVVSLREIQTDEELTHDYGW